MSSAPPPMQGKGNVMQRLIAWGSMSFAAALLSGCASEKAPTWQGPLFCDEYEPRVFTQEEIDWRAANAPWNLRRDLKNNAAYRAECS